MTLFGNIKSIASKRVLVNNIQSENEWLKKFRIKTFIDIGAYVGEYVDFSKNFYPKAIIYAYEPVKESFSLLKKKIGIDPNIRIFNYAIGDKNKMQKIFKSSYSPSSSILPMANLHKTSFPKSAKNTVQTVQEYTLDYLMKDINLAEDIFIKVDTQGYEDKVIDGGKTIFKKAKIIQIEVSFEELYENQVLFHDIYKRLYALGFFFHGIKNQVRSPIHGTILQSHAYFIKP